MRVIGWACLEWLLAVCAVGATLWRDSRSRPEAGMRRSYRTAIEKDIEEHLSDLEQRGARVFHGLHLGGMKLEHVVISSQGIYVVEVRNWRRTWDTATIHLYGDQSMRLAVPPDSNAARQMGTAVHWLERFLAGNMEKSPSVRGVVVFPRGWPAQAPAKASDHGVVCLSDPKSLPSFIKRQPQVLDARTVKLAAAHLSRYLRDPMPRLLPRVTSR